MKEMIRPSVHAWEHIGTDRTDNNNSKNTNCTTDGRTDEAQAEKHKRIEKLETRLSVSDCFRKLVRQVVSKLELQGPPGRRNNTYRSVGTQRKTNKTNNEWTRDTSCWSQNYKQPPPPPLLQSVTADRDWLAIHAWHVAAINHENW